jgi:DNA-binding MarR family transcriptional regulator
MFCATAVNPEMPSGLQAEEPTLSTDTETTSEESVDAITDALLTASRLLVAVSARSIAAVDDAITFPQFRALVILSSRGSVNLATLAGLLDVKPSAAGRMVDRLVSAGLIDRQPHPTSRRELLAVLTPRGRKIVRQVTAHRRREIAGIVEKMPPAQRRGLVRALTAFTAAGGEPAAGLDGDD